MSIQVPENKKDNADFELTWSKRQARMCWTKFSKEQFSYFSYQIGLNLWFLNFFASAIILTGYKSKYRLKLYY